MLRHAISVGILLCAGLPASGQEFTQPDPLASDMVRAPLNTGVVQNQGHQLAPVYSTEVTVDGAEWLRLWFDEVELAGTPGVDGSFLMITSMDDGAWQRLDAEHIENWSNSSAYFNGDTVLLELWAHPGTGPNRLVFNEVMAGEPTPDIETICGTEDNRTLAYDTRVGRLSSGCTGWLIDVGGSANTYVTAGHCISAGTTGAVMFFNVPLSTSGGGFRAPPPEYQYPVQNGSIRSTNGGVGNDFATFRTHSNSNTGLSPMTAQGAAFGLTTPPAANNQTVRVTGYGLRDANFPQIPLEWSRTQKTHTGPLTANSSNTIRYRPDTTGGNSGSPVILESSGLAIGVHTHGGCGASSTSSNAGTGYQHPTFQSYVSSPQGTSIDQAPLDETSTFFASNNGGSEGGAIYFDVEMQPATVTVRALELNIGSDLSSEFDVLVYITPDTADGKQTDAGAWTLVGEGWGLATGTDNPTRVVLNDTFTLEGGQSYGIALVLDGARHRYTNGTGSNEVHTAGAMTITAAGASNVPFTGLISSRVFNGTLLYDYDDEWIIGNLIGNGGTRSAALGDGRIKGMGFTIPGGNPQQLGSVGLRLSINGPSTFPLVRVYSGSPSSIGSLIATLNNPASFFEGDGTYFFNPSSPLNLSAGSTYWVVVYNTGSDSIDWTANTPAILPTGIASHAGSLFSASGGPNPPTGSSGILNSYAVYAPPASNCPVDLNNDGNLNFFDISMFVTFFQGQNPVADWNNDGLYNFFDFSAFLAEFNAGCP